jgi:hypothetical protein
METHRRVRPLKHTTFSIMGLTELGSQYAKRNETVKTNKCICVENETSYFVLIPKYH